MKFLKNTIALFTKNWWLKLIALVLAVIIYHSENSDSTRTTNTMSYDRPLIQLN